MTPTPRSCSPRRIIAATISKRRRRRLIGVDVSSNPLVISQYPTLNVAKLQSFKGQTPYEVRGDGQRRG